MALPLQARRSDGLSGSVRVPGDKSISHRAVMLGALAVGETVIEGLLESADVIRTVQAMAALGARVERHQDGGWHVTGCGVGGFVQPEGTVDFGNSGTGVRLAAGLVATTPIRVIFTGDESLSRRPMGRIVEPLTRFGARIDTAPGGTLPMRIIGAADPVPVEYALPVPSAQVKSAVLLAGLNAPGETTVIEPVATRDHTERMLRAFGADIREEATEKGRRITVRGEKELKACAITVPGDPSSAAFPLAAAVICPGSGDGGGAAHPGAAEFRWRDHRRRDGRRFVPEGRRGAGAPRPFHDRRVSRAGGHRRLRRGHHPDGGAGRAQGEGKRPADGGGGGTGGLRRAGAGRGRLAGGGEMIATSFPEFVPLMRGLGADIEELREDA